MSFPDYNQKAEDHKSVLILVKSINGSTPGTQLSSKVFNKLYDKISNIDELAIEDAQGMGYKRIIKLRFVKNVYQNENNDWGDFQAHRKLLGLIGIGKFSEGNDEEMQELYNQFQTLVDKYSCTLYDSRFVLFHIKSQPQAVENNCSNNGSHQELKSNESCQVNGNTQSSSSSSSSSNSPPPSSLSRNDLVNNQEVPKSIINLDTTDATPKPPQTFVDPLSVLSTNNEHHLTDEEPQNSANLVTQSAVINRFKLQKSLTQCLVYNNINNECEIHASTDQFEVDVKDFISSLFWVLESKRLDRSYERIDKVPLLMAPFETKALIGIDTDSKTFRKKCYGRMRKHIGDLSLLAGLASEALTHYGSAVEVLRSANDWLWLASALEGQCVASLTLLYPQATRRKSSLQRNSSLPPNKFRQLQKEANQKTMKSGNLGRRFLSSSIKSRVTPINDQTMIKALGKCLLNSIDDVYEKYKEACCHYAKSRYVAIIELECSFKASRVLTRHEKFLYASEFIQNAVFISFNQSHDEQIKKLSVISDLYTDIGYRRKAAFYKRFAALKAVSLNIQNPNWQQCYYLLLPALEGYHLTLDPLEYDRRVKGGSIGWTGIHLQILQELVTAAKRMSAEPLAMRHLSFLLHSLFEHLTSSQRRDFAKQLETLAANCGEGAPVPLALDNGNSVPSVNLTKFPLVVSFKVQNLPAHTRPFKLKLKHRESISSSPSSPFIFTPLQFNRPISRRKFSTVSSQTVDFKWAEGETCQVLLEVFNWLPIELSVSHMSLMTDGIALETYPTSLTLPPESGPFPVQVTGTPRASGKLDILGYTTHVLGNKNNCKLRDLPHAKKMKFPHMYTVEVVPPLPLLDVICCDSTNGKLLPTLKHNQDVIMTNVAVKLFAGETVTVPVTLANKSTNGELIEIISTSLDSKLAKDLERSVIYWNDDDIQNGLPLAPSASSSFLISVFGMGDFYKQMQRRKASNQLKSRSGAATPLPYHSTHGSPSHTLVPFKKKEQNLFGAALSSFLSDSLNGSSKTKSSSETVLPLPEELPKKQIDAMLNFEFSGGKGLASGFCRRCALRLNIEVVPSVVITHWDVLPAEIVDHCYLVFDVLNATDQEMELFYAANKSILIEAKETCRIPVPIQRCPLSDTDNQNEETTISKEALRLHCKKYVVEQVQLKWIVAGKEKSGIASIAGIPWTPAMLDAILMSSVMWEVKVNEKVVTPAEELLYSVGQSITFDVSITNASGNPLKSVHLWLQCYQDDQNGHRNYRLDMKRSLIGADKVFLDQVNPSEKYTHKCVFVFFYPGSYKIDVQCSGVDSSNSDQLKTRCDEISKSSSNTNASLNPSCGNPETNTWKYSPAIEINVTE